METSFLPTVENRAQNLNVKLEELKRQNAESLNNKTLGRSLNNQSTLVPIKFSRISSPARMRQHVKVRGELEDEFPSLSVLPSRATIRAAAVTEPEVGKLNQSQFLMRSLPSASTYLPNIDQHAMVDSGRLSREQSLPSEVRFVSIDDATRTWYPGESPPKSRSTAYRKFRRQRPDLKISTTPQSNLPTSSNFYPPSSTGTRSIGTAGFPLAIDAGRVVTALKMATDMNPVMRSKYLDFFQDLQKRQKPNDPFASDEASSESLL
jgi:hypothetical protein